MITKIKYRNFKMLREADLPLGRLTLLIGPNGSGKSTALDGLKVLGDPGRVRFGQLSIGCDPLNNVGAITLERDDEPSNVWIVSHGGMEIQMAGSTAPTRPANPPNPLRPAQSMCVPRVFSLEADSISHTTPLRKVAEPLDSGGELANVLTTLQDGWPERFESLNADVGEWLPQFDRILLDTPADNQRAFAMRTRQGRHRISAAALSHGERFAVALLAISHLPDPPEIIGLEEPDRGIHPRLLRDLLTSVRRLSNPEDFGDPRVPVQVIITTHSPYMVDLFRDSPEEIVLTKREGLYATFERLVDQPSFEDVLRDAHLGDAWYSGLFGGVPQPC